MGFFEGLWETAKSAVSSLLDFGKEIVEKVTERVEKVVEAIEKGDWPGVFEQVVSTVTDVVEGISKVGEKVTEIFEDVAGVVFEGLEQVISTIGTVSKFLLDQFKEHPQECIEILVSLAGAAANFAAGNIAGGVACLSSAFVKVARLRDQVGIEQPDLPVKQVYPLPPAVDRLQEEVKDVPTEKLDSHFAARAKEYNLANA